MIKYSISVYPINIHTYIPLFHSLSIICISYHTSNIIHHTSYIISNSYQMYINVYQFISYHWCMMFDMISIWYDINWYKNSYIIHHINVYQFISYQIPIFHGPASLTMTPGTPRRPDWRELGSRPGQAAWLDEKNLRWSWGWNHHLFHSLGLVTAVTIKTIKYVGIEKKGLLLDSDEWWW